jgi:hypothetical protein
VVEDVEQKVDRFLVEQRLQVRRHFVFAGKKNRLLIMGLQLGRG